MRYGPLRTSLRTITLLASFALVLALGQRLSAQSIYWSATAQDTINWQELDGAGGGTVITKDSGLAQVCGGIAIDANAEKIYWTDWGIDIIGSANLDGTDAGVLIDLRAEFVGINPAARGIALDPERQQLYWADSSQGKIFRANCDGTGVERLVESLGAPRDVALDLEHGKMYWTENSAGMLSCANLDGTNVQRALHNSLNHPVEVALDVANGHIYWSASFAIQRGNLDGTGTPITLINDPDVPTGLALDVVNQQIYWGTNTAAPEWIRRANFDGDHQENVIKVVDRFITIALRLPATDVDSDGDGVPDEEDAFPNDPTEQSDNDNDGIGDNADDDDDNDGLKDHEEDVDGDGIVDPTETDPNIADTDGDGTDDGVDAFPLDSDVSSLEEFAIDIRDLVLNEALIFDSDLKRSNLRRPLKNKLTSLIETLRLAEAAPTDELRQDFLIDAADKLANDLITKTDGDQGGNRKNDWLVTTAGRQLLYTELETLLLAILDEL